MEAEVLDDWSEAQYFILEPNVHTSFLPTSAVGVRISDALIEMRKLMSAEGKTPWNKIRFTLQRDGKFHVDYSYDPGIENE